ncbi:MAG TPA: hypothetical protein VEN81_15395 [Planctomycetota bacterium]|nr:hypothetical protein [Planctomycetota bacterium]
MATHPGRHSASGPPVVPFARNLPRTVDELERAVDELLDSGWEEPYRIRALGFAEALADAATAKGLSPIASLTRASASLLRLPREEALRVRDALRDKVHELLGFLRELCSDSKDALPG